MIPEGTPSQNQIATKLLETYKAAVRDHGLSISEEEPFLSVLFRVFGSQMASIYQDQARVREALLDELITVLGVEPRRARPAQTVVRAELSEGLESRVRIAEDTILMGETPEHDRVEFRTDASILASGVRIPFVFAYQDHRLEMLASGVTGASPLSEMGYGGGVHAALRWGEEPAVVLVLEGLPLEEHTAGLSIYLDTPDAALREVLRDAIWRLCSTRGDFPSEGILRSFPGQGGVRLLQWFRLAGRSSVVQRAAPEPFESGSLEGPFGPSLFVFPEEKARAKFSCRCPKALEPAIASRAFQDYTQVITGTERVWLRISLPSYGGQLASAIYRILTNVVTISNVEVFDQEIDLAAQGRVIPIQPEGHAGRFLIAPRSIVASSKIPYVSGLVPTGEPGVGRYFLRNDRIELHPPRRPDGTEDTKATVSLWVTNGVEANRIPTGDLAVTLELDDASNQTVNLRSIQPTRGGSDGEAYGEAKNRFASAVLSRGRVVTQADVRAVAIAFDGRIQDAHVQAGLERTQDGLGRVYRVTLVLYEERFAEEDERRILIEDLEKRLQQAAPLDVAVRVNWRPGVAA